MERSPLSVMVRGVLERVFEANHLDELFEKTAEKGYTRELLFSTLVRLMSEVVLGISPSVHAAYQDAGEPVGVSVTAVYDKLAGLELGIPAAFVRDLCSSWPRGSRPWRESPRAVARLPRVDPGWEPSGVDRTPARVFWPAGSRWNWTNPPATGRRWFIC